MKKTIGTVIGIGLVLLLGCAAPTPSGPTLASKIEDLVGVWHRTELAAVEVYIEFKEDGTCRFATVPDSELELHPLMGGEFWFEGTQLHWKVFDAVGTWRACLAEDRQVGIYQVELLPNGNLKFVKIEDKCGDRFWVLVEKFKKPTEWEPLR